MRTHSAISPRTATITNYGGDSRSDGQGYYDYQSDEDFLDEQDDYDMMDDDF